MVEIVIKIPDKLYEYIVKGKDLSEEQNDEMALAIAEGIPLPKGHGRIIDADDIALIDEQFYVLSDYYVVESAIDNASTIIKAE